MAVQVDLFFDHFNSAWSERYYLAPPQDTPEWVLRQIAEARFKLLCFPAFLRRGQVFTTALPKIRTRVDYGWPGAYTIARPSLVFNNPLVPCEPPQVTTTMHFRTGSGGRRVMHIAGIPRWPGFAVNSHFSLFVPSKWYGLLDNFRDLLLSPGINLQIRTESRGLGVNRKAIVKIDTDARFRYRVHLAEDWPGLFNLPVKVMGSRGVNLGNIRGHRRIVERADNRTLTLDAGPNPAAPLLNYSGGATLVEIITGYEKAEFVPVEKTTPAAILGGGSIRLTPSFGYGGAVMNRYAIRPSRRGRARARS